MKLFRNCVGAVVAISILCLLYGFLVEPKTLSTRYVEITSNNYVGDPLRIAFIADIHVGGIHVSADRVKDIVEKINAQKPNLVLLGGDYVNGHESRQQSSETFNAEITKGIMALGKLDAPLGVYAVIGNHDNWYDGSYLTEQLTLAGISVLNNAVAMTDEDVCIAGLSDYDTSKPNPEILEHCPAGAPQIGLMHSPDSLLFIPSSTALVLAGHTHGGQINIPLIGRRFTPTNIGSEYAYGVKNFRDVPVYITSGIGTSILPARFCERPEIVIITLRSG